MNQKHTNHEDLEDSEWRVAFLAIEKEFKALHETIKMNQLLTEERVKLHAQQVEVLSNVVKDSQEAYKKSQEELKELLSAVQTIKAGMKITNFLRNVLIFCGSIATSYIALAQAFKDHIK